MGWEHWVGKGAKEKTKTELEKETGQKVVMTGLGTEMGQETGL